MKIISSTSLIFALFLCTQVYAGSSKDSLAVGKRMRTFATAPAVVTCGVAVKTSAARGVVSIKGGNSGGEIITAKGKLVLVENGADVGVKFINTTQELTTVVVSTMPTLTRVTTSGITVTKNVDKTVTILGKYNDDIRYLLDDLEYPKTLDFEAKKNGYNLLNAPDELYLTAEQFWLQFNKPFLDKAILRGDDIVLATNPTDAALNVFDDAGSIVGRSGFGREYDHLLANGYVFDDVSKKMVNAVVISTDELTDFISLHNISLSTNKVEYIIQITGGQRNLCESILLSTKEVVSGQNLNQLVQHFNIQVLPSPSTLSNYQTRIWYKWRKGEIPNLLDNTKSLEQQAEQAFNLRNQFRTNARTHMSDRPLANYLESVEQNITWQQMKDKYPNLSGDALWNKIIEKSSSGREGVDDLFNLNDL